MNQNQDPKDKKDKEEEDFNGEKKKLLRESGEKTDENEVFPDLYNEKDPDFDDPDEEEFK